MADQARKEWLRTNRCTLVVAKEYFHNNASIIADRYGTQLRPVRAALGSRIAIEASIRKGRGEGRRGITAESVNSGIRRELKRMLGSEIRLECELQDGYFSASNGRGGFDFAFIDEVANTTVYRNRCLGYRQYADGAVRWRKSVRKRLGLTELPMSNPVHVAAVGTDIEVPRSTAHILGEIQCGNWGLLYYDLFKALEAVESGVLDLFIYVCPTGSLRDFLSAQIVHFDFAEAEVRRLSNVLRFPIWIIGVDARDYSEKAAKE